VTRALAIVLLLASSAAATAHAARPSAEHAYRLLNEWRVDEARSAARHADQGLQTLDGDLKDEEQRAWRGSRPGAQNRKTAREHAEQGEQR